MVYFIKIQGECLSIRHFVSVVAVDCWLPPTEIRWPAPDEMGSLSAQMILKLVTAGWTVRALRAA
jgi:hypothetical protein